MVETPTFILSQDKIHEFITNETNDCSIYYVFFSSEDKGPELTFQALTDQCRMLYQGEAREEFGDRSPWLVKLNEDDTTLDYAINECFGKKIGVFLISSNSFDELAGHLRRFVKIKQKDGDFLFFHFFDPDHLSNILPFFTIEQRKYFFEKIKTVIVEIHDYRTRTVGSIHCQDDGKIRLRSILYEGLDPQKLKLTEIIHGAAEVELASAFDYDFSGTTIRPYLTLTSDQMEAPIVLTRRKLVIQLLTDLDDEFGKELQILPPAFRYANISVGVDHAMSYRVFHYNYIYAFIKIMLSVAPGWHKEPTLNAILKKADLTNEQKFSLMTEKRYDKEWENATSFSEAKYWMSDEWQELSNG